jgi:tetraacyldisaccharide 4'-kinase
MQQPQFWQRKSILSITLLPLAAIYRLASHLRYSLISPYQPKLPVICIGNITIGGAGKTPTAIAIAKLLQEAGRNPIFLSRGYGGSIATPTMVDNTKHTAGEGGDEPLLLSRIAKTIISKNRIAGAKLAEQSGADVIIMDDGLQNPTIKKTLSLLVLDGGYGIGNGQIIPSGPLRESLGSALDKSTAVILIGNDTHNLAAKITGKPLIKAKIQAKVATHNTNQTNYIAFAGLANPNKFFNTLRENNYPIIETVSFSDHYIYSNNDIEKLKEKAKKNSAGLITTEKDFVRLTKEQQQYVQTLPVEIIWEDIGTIKEILKI